MEDDVKFFGFWIYLMTDLVIFSVLFATFVVLRNNTFGGPSGRDLFALQSPFAETLLLLVSSFTCSLATLAVHRKQEKWTIFWFIVTFGLGIAFLVLELKEFVHFIRIGAGPERSAFLSSFFTLVGTHGLHISCGLLWMLFSTITVWIRGLTHLHASQILRLASFWHFLDIVWIFIFSIVYGMGHLYA